MDQRGAGVLWFQLFVQFFRMEYDVATHHLVYAVYQHCIGSNADEENMNVQLSCALFLE